MATHERADWLGTGHIDPAGPAVAGAYSTWTIDYVVGVSGVDDGGSVRLAFRMVSDSPAPQFDDPSGPNYVGVRSTADVSLAPSYGLHGVRPWARTLTVRVGDGALAPGDRVTIQLGDTSFGGPGMRAQTYPESRHCIKLQVDPFGTGVFGDVSDLVFPIVGGDASELVVVAPSDTVEGDDGWLHIRALDQWGNPDPAYQGTVTLSGDVPDGVPETYTFSVADRGIRRFENLRYHPAGDRPLRVSVHDEHGLSATSNPIRCHASPPTYRTFWGDLHGQTEETVGTGTIAEYFSYARDVAAVDIAAHSGNDFQITNGLYDELHAAVEHFHDHGRFVTFHGYEWSGNTAAGGDHNVYYRDGGPIRRSSHTLILDTSDADTDCYPIDQLYAVNSGREDVLITPHIGGRRASLDFHDPDLEPAIEIASQWGRFEWFAREALERDMRVAFIAGSDDHSGRPGWSAPTLAHHGVRGGLTAFQATDVTRDAIWEALRSRRCYGTSGPRILVDVTVNGHPMGSEPVLDGPPVIAVNVAGTAPLDTIEVRRGLEPAHLHTVRPQASRDDPWRVRVAWRGARNRDRSRALDWSGVLHVHHGRIVGAEDYAIDSPLDGIVRWQADRVEWRSHTCGDWDGIILDLEGDDGTILELRSKAATLSWSLADIATQSTSWSGPGLEQVVVVDRLASKTGASEARFEWRDDAPREGVNPYWIWVTQADGELAWSSPVYATWQPAVSAPD